MGVLEDFRRKWLDMRDEARREVDERQRLLRLLAVRDAFVALIVLSMLQVVAQLDSVRGYGLVPDRVSGLAPLYAAASAMLVMLISLRLRGGGAPSRVAAFRATVAAGSVILGLLLGLLINFLLWQGGVMKPVSANSLVGYGIALLVIVPTALFLLRQRRPPET